MTNPTVTAKEALEAARNFLMQFVEGEPQGLLIHPDVDATAFTHAWDDTSSKVRAALECLDAGPVEVGGDEINRMADAIDAARYAHPTNPRFRPRPFSEADRSDREYAFRLARAAFSALSPSEPTKAGWRPMETAPKDGGRVLASGPDRRVPEIIFWESYDAETAEEVGEHGYWRYSDDVVADVAEVDLSELTHWMPLPTAPETRT